MRWGTISLCCLSLGTMLYGRSLLSATAITFSAGELLGRPTDKSVTVNAFANQAVEAYFEYGTQPGAYSAQTSANTFSDGGIEVVVNGLAADTRYYYRMRYRVPGTGAWLSRDEHSFHTQRSPSSTFVFTVQSDSHQGYPGFHSDQLYNVALKNQLADSPDFLFDLGDAVSLDGYNETAQTVGQKYLKQRTSLALAAHSVPVFLILGNHENEEGWNLDDTGANRAASLPVLGANGRKKYFLNPIPSPFYSGNLDTDVQEVQGDHLKEDYYAFELGNALFVGIDPFWYTLKKPYAGSLGGEKNDEVVGNRWDWTLGDEQYLWLKQTLETSTAKFKFVFTHHITGGLDDYVRGGARGAAYCEWGGYNTDGTWGFDTHRPGWPTPIHDILVSTGVTILFHGHDHVFAKEELDGIVYQECPHAANAGYGPGFPTNAQDYAGGDLVNNSGHVRVTVAASEVKVEYVRAYLPGAGTNGTVAHSYTITR